MRQSEYTSLKQIRRVPLTMRKQMLHSFGSLLVLISVSVTPLAAQQIRDTAKQQIADILRVKRSLNHNQRKLSSDLNFASMKARHLSLVSIPNSLTSSSRVSEAGGGVLVDIKANSLPAAMTRVTAVGGTILSASSTGAIIRARIPLLSMELVAASDAVRTIRTPSLAVANHVRLNSPFSSPTAPLTPLSEQRRQSLKANVQTALPLLAANGFYPSLRSLLPVHMNPFIGAVTSQGYITHTANQAVSLGYDGTGVRIGVLSTSATAARVAALIATGDLPPDLVVVPGQDGASDDEGTAMMEIIHDMAPGAKLFFATAFNGEQSFADNIRTLRFTYKCDILVDDVSYFDEPAFQDGLVAQAVNDGTADGGLYFSSAANSGNLTSNQSGTWEGDFQSAGDAGTFIDGLEGGPVQVHNFASAGSPLPYNILTGSTSAIILHWSDPLGASDNDYDLFLLDSTGTNVLAASTDTQNGTQDPIEGFTTNTGFPPGSQIVVVLYNGTTRALHVDTERGRLAIGTSGATIGHNAGLNTVSMAATAWNSARRGTAVFTSANPVEYFSSDGPRKIFYYPDGTPITPDNFLFSTNGGTTLQKPDLTGADGV